MVKEEKRRIPATNNNLYGYTMYSQDEHDKKKILSLFRNNFVYTSIFNLEQQTPIYYSRAEKRWNRIKIIERKNEFELLNFASSALHSWFEHCTSHHIECSWSIRNAQVKNVFDHMTTVDRPHWFWIPMKQKNASSISQNCPFVQWMWTILGLGMLE